jgi:hypothetical protein
MHRRILSRPSSFAVNTRKREKEKLYQPEVMTVTPPKIEKNKISLKQGESAIFISTNFDPIGARTIKIFEGNKVINDYDVEYVSDVETKITAKNDINGDIKIFFSENTLEGELIQVQEYSVGNFKMPISLRDLFISSFIVNEQEKLKEPIKWEILNHFMVDENIYGEMFNKLFKNLSGWSSHINSYETELIQQFTWPKGIKWKIKLRDFEIDSESLENIKTEYYESKIKEWDVKGIWSSKWVILDGVKKEKIIKGSWEDVVSKLVPFECFSNGIIYPQDKTFSFCLTQENTDYVFNSEEK